MEGPSGGWGAEARAGVGEGLALSLSVMPASWDCCALAIQLVPQPGFSWCACVCVRCVGGGWGGGRENRGQKGEPQKVLCQEGGVLESCPLASPVPFFPQLPLHILRPSSSPGGSVLLGVEFDGLCGCECPRASLPTFLVWMGPRKVEAAEAGEGGEKLLP